MDGPTSNETPVAPPPSGKPTGTTERAPQRMAGAVLAFDLDHEAAQLRGERAWLAGDRNAKTLASEADFTTVLMILRAGSRLVEHQAAGQIAIQTLAGRLRLLHADAVVELPPGRFVGPDRALPHTVEAVEDSAFLLTLGRQGMIWVADESPRSPDLPEGGRHGTSVGVLDPDGVVRLDGQLWSARVAAGRVEPGRPVRVLAREGLTLLVVPAAPGAYAGERQFPDVD